MMKPYKCRVEYLESSGTQYIDTGYKTKANSTVDICIAGSEFQSGKYLFGSVGSSTDSLIRCLLYNTSSYGDIFSLQVGAYGVKANGYISYDTNYHRYLITPTTASIDNLSYQQTRIDNEDRTFYIFAFNTSGTLNPAKGKFKYCKISEGGVLVHYFIPVLDNSGRPAMYDQVSGQLFYNQGSGDDFSYGRQIIPVEYLESTGEQYIDTGIIPTSTTETKMGVEILSIPSTFACFGGTDIPNNSQATYAILRKETNASNFNFRTNYNNAIYCSLDTNKKYDIIMNEYGSRNLIVNGDLIGTFTDAVSVDIPIYLFARNSNGTAQTQYSLDTRLYYFSIKDSTGKLVRDYIPCIDENGVGYMFDLVTNTCYLNAGTGQFKVGPYQADNFNKKLLRKKLALMLATLKKKRKYYCELEYLEGTGTQYIDTGLDYFADFEIGIQLRTNVSNKALGNGGYYCMQRQNSATPTWQFTSGSSNFYNSTTPITEHHVMKWKDNKVYSDDTFLTNFAKGSNIPHRMYLYTTGTNNKYPNIIYFCKLWNPDNGVLVRDFIPVLDWDMTPCMYDRVTEQLFYNAGTGDFTAGREIHPVDYLESTGTQYIDTGIQPTDDYGYKIRNTYTRGGGEQCAIGCMDSGNRFVGVYTSGTENQLSGAWGSFVGFLPTYSWATGDILDVEVNYKNSGKMIVGGTELKDISDIHISGTISNTLYLFARHYGNTITIMKGNVYGVEITNGQNVVADFIPAIDENGVGYMFDRVSHTCFLNQGTGVFKYPAREVEYLESTGTQYIDTGVYRTSNGLSTGNDLTSFSFKGVVEYTALGKRRLMGDSGSNNGFWGIAANNKLETGATSTYVALVNTKYKIDFIATASDLTLVANLMDGTEVVNFSRSAVVPTKVTNATFDVFALGGSFINSDTRVYEYQVLIDNTLKRSLIPAFKDGAAGMWDKANNVFYPNAGTGDGFITGKIVEPEYE